MVPPRFDTEGTHASRILKIATRTHHAGQVLYSRSVLLPWKYSPFLVWFGLVICGVCSSWTMSDTIVELAVGDYVECRYDGGDMWYEGKITAKHADGTYNVLYDDGDTEDFVPLMHLRLNEDAEPSDDEAYEQSNPTSSGGIDFAALKDTLSPEALAALAGHLNVDAGIEIKAPTEEEIAAKKAEHQRRLDEKARVLEETMKRLREQSTQEEQDIQDELGAPGIVASSPEEAVSALRSLGVVRLDGMVPANLCDELLAVINKKLDKSIESLSPEEMQPERGFGTILARKNRYDMYVRPDGLVGECLKQILTGGRGAAAVDAEAVPDGVDPSWNLAKFFKQVFDGQPDAKFSELSCIISDAGAPRQPLHPDTHWEDIPPIFSVFLALQDIDEAMGEPTCLKYRHSRFLTS